mmetsp:Transcript_11518/g.22253  ORF Transcript_11518/g.22253 Transcript_11518/m.22253 type:complete len:229 (-) Transcript_11518:748-1434(-)
MLDERSFQLRLWWEALHLLVVDCSHQSSLSAIIWAKQAVVPATLQIEPCVVEQGEGTIPKREHAIAQVLTLLLLYLIGLDAVGRLEAEVACTLCDICWNIEVAEHLRPDCLVEVSVGREATTYTRQVHSDVCYVIIPAIFTDWVFDGCLDGFRVGTADLSGLLCPCQCAVRLLSNTACFRIRDLVSGPLEHREKHVQKWQHLTRVRDQVHHVVDDYAGLALGWLLLVF